MSYMFFFSVFRGAELTMNKNCTHLALDSLRVQQKLLSKIAVEEESYPAGKTEKEAETYQIRREGL